MFSLHLAILSWANITKDILMGASLFVILGLFAAGALAGVFESSDNENETGDTDQPLTDGNDTFNGSAGDDIIDARGGDDLVATNGGDDLVRLGAGDDAWADNDFSLLLDPNQFASLPPSGDDTVSGGTGDDAMVSVSGSDVLSGGFGHDSMLSVDLDFNNGVPLPDAPDTLDGGEGNDTLGGDDGDVLTGGNGADDFKVLLTQDPSVAPLEASTDSPVHITDFAPDEDMLTIELIGGLDFDVDDVSFEEDSATGDILLTADEITFVRLSGVAFSDLTAANFSILVS